MRQCQNFYKAHNTPSVCFQITSLNEGAHDYWTFEVCKLIRWPEPAASALWLLNWFKFLPMITVLLKKVRVRLFYHWKGGDAILQCCAKHVCFYIFLKTTDNTSSEYLKPIWLIFPSWHCQLAQSEAFWHIYSYSRQSFHLMSRSLLLV